MQASLVVPYMALGEAVITYFSVFACPLLVLLPSQEIDMTEMLALQKQLKVLANPWLFCKQPPALQGLCAQEARHEGRHCKSRLMTFAPAFCTCLAGHRDVLHAQGMQG